MSVELTWGRFRVFFRTRPPMTGDAETYADIWRAISNTAEVTHVHFHALGCDAATFRERAMRDLAKE